MASVLDSDQHLYEPRTMWLDHIDPGRRDDALRIVDDELGYVWVVWRGAKLAPADVQRPRETSALGTLHERIRSGRAPETRYDDDLPIDYWDASARADRLAAMGVDEAVAFPNFGLLWERTLDADLGALTANMTAWNRWCASVAVDGRGKVHPVAHVTLRDQQWLSAELARLERDGVHLAMVAPALVDGRPLSHPDHDPIWRAFVERGVTPLFHVADQRRPFADGWYTDPPDAFVPTLDSVFLWTAAALSCTDLILNGTLERHPELRIGIVELERGVGADVLDDARRRFRLHRPPQRSPARPAVDAAERVLPPAGARIVVLVRVAGSVDPPVRRPLHVLLRLPALGGHGDAVRRLHGWTCAGRSRRRARVVPRQPVDAVGAPLNGPAAQRRMRSSSGSEPWNHSVVSTRLAIFHPASVRTKSSS